MVNQYLSFTVDKFDSANSVLSDPVNDENRKKRGRTFLMIMICN